MTAFGSPARRRRRGRPFRSPYRRGGNGGGIVIAGVVLAAAASAGAQAAVASAHAAAKAKPAPARAVPVAGNAAAARVTAFAAAQVGRVPYAWGGTTSAGMDCSGLAMEAYAAAGITIERTSQEQWASERHVTTPAAGDLVFFPGSDGTWSAPGHVGIVVNPATHTMIDAYETGTYVRHDTYGLASSAPGLGSVVGFTDPASPVTATAAPAPGEAGYIAAVLASVGAPASGANEASVADWIRDEWPSWPPGAANNALDTTLAMPGSRDFNTFDGDLHVQAYPSAAEGVQATAATLLGGYPAIVAALRSGDGIAGDPGVSAELSEWSGGHYSEVG